MTAKISPCLWFDGKAEEAATFYTSTFPDSHITGVHRAPSDSPGGAAGGVLTVEFTILGMPFTGLNGPPIFNFTEAVSFQVPTDTQLLRLIGPSRENPHDLRDYDGLPCRAGSDLDGARFKRPGHRFHVDGRGNEIHAVENRRGNLGSTGLAQ